MERFYVEAYLRQREADREKERNPSRRSARETEGERSSEWKSPLFQEPEYESEKEWSGNGRDRFHPPQAEVSRWTFETLCQGIKERFLQDWDQEQENLNTALQMQKRAMIGYQNEVAYFKGKIRKLLEEYGAVHVSYPVWYDSLVDGVYHENWGMAGIAEWFGESFSRSSSAKIIGERIYFMENGRMCLKPQTIGRERREQLIRAFLLLSPEERLDKEFHEVYLLDGTRITIFGEGLAKSGQDAIIFRRYVVPSFSFEEQARRHTIPEEAIPLFCAMVDCGYNVAFTGAVRSAKTTFLSTWQRYENPALEGVMVETDPEIPLHRMMPEAPIVQLVVPENQRMTTISKNLLRSDADYFILAEARDGVALDTAVRIASKGTRRMKITFHTRNPLDFPEDAAAEIVRSLGGEMKQTASRVAASFDYVFHFVQLKDKSKKRLSGIYELRWERESGEIKMEPLCRYRYKSDDWEWFNTVSEEKQKAAEEEDTSAWQRFYGALSELADQSKQAEERKAAENGACV